ncbi:MAG: hypothetical protein HOP11_01330 [Saprospiraceae bacterium]|nr:hypothetical protein [Saprospiraceae bacterium]
MWQSRKFHVKEIKTSTGKTLWRLKNPVKNFGLTSKINLMQENGKRKVYVLTSTIGL